MSFIKKTADFWAKFNNRLTIRFESTPIDSLALLTDFAATRAAFVAQKTLYGYLKTRMGTRYPTMFDDKVFVDSINIAKLHVFAGCLSDLCIYVVAYALREIPGIDDQLRCRIARQCFEAGLANNEGQVDSVEQFSGIDAMAEFDIRLSATTWADAAMGRENFLHSPTVLVKWAPIAPELKKYDAAIVKNSIMFAWHSTRDVFKKRVDPAKISAEAALQAQT